MAKKYLVSLVSQQTIPNILGIREMGDVDQYIFIYTKEMELQMGYITKATKISTRVMLPVLVDAVAI